MSIALSVHPDHGLAYFRFRGHVDVPACAQIFLDYARHPRFDPQHVMLTSSVELETVDASFLRILTAVDKLAPTFRFFRHDCVSVIHARNDVFFGLARMMQQITEPLSKFRYEICRTEAEALRAAGLPDTCFAALDQRLGLQTTCA